MRHDALLQLLRTRPNLPAAQVRAALGISPPTLMRVVRAAGPSVLTLGKARRTTYAARRPLRGSLQPLPVFQIDEQGHYDQVADLDLAEPHGSCLTWSTQCPWPLDDSMQDGWFDGVPYFLQDLRPAGFLGRAFAHAHAAALELGEDPKLWSEEDALLAMSKFGEDPVGNLLLGRVALQRWLAQLQNPVRALGEAELAEGYATRADQAMAYGLPGSSAGGEFPKFTATLDDQGTTVKVIVKFSGSDQSPGSRRWSDLLICEHLAAQTLHGELGIATAQTRVLQSDGRTFLQVTRFDRHAAHGRSAVCSWEAINYAWFGLAGRPWPDGTTVLLSRNLIEVNAAQTIAQLWHFGKLIGNSDMHDGNLSFRPHQIKGKPAFALAPAYDMLPMLYAPTRGVELPVVTFQPTLPLPMERENWLKAARAASAFWNQAAGDRRISPEFRQICARNLKCLQNLARLAGGG